MKRIKLYEEYIKYSDYQDPRYKRLSAFGDKDRMMSDARNFLFRDVLPSPDMLKDIKDVSVEDAGIKFEVKLTNGDVIHLYRLHMTNSIWEVYYNKKKVSGGNPQSTAQFRAELENKFMSPVERFLKYAPSFDYEVDYIDDGKQWRRAKDNNSRILQMFQDLSNSDKKKAIAELKKIAKHDHIKIDHTFKI
jgi:hypothetical protein